VAELLGSWQLDPAGWLLLAVAALLVGFAKTAVGAVATVSVAIFAAVLPARESTGAMLPLLILGDVVAVRAYARHADWPRLVRLLPPVAVGVVVGAVFVAVADDTVMRRTIGAVLLLLVVVHVLAARRRIAERASAPPPGGGGRAAGDRTAALGFGWLSGFTTMVANAGGAAMSLYLLRSGLGVLAFLGTAAWFFLVVNLAKLPFSVGLGLVTPASLALGAVLALPLLAGAAVGRWVIRRIDQRRFEVAVLAATVLGALYLVR
jgi:uncharacterized protein